jgi:hypothetical protein
MYMRLALSSLYDAFLFFAALAGSCLPAAAQDVPRLQLNVKESLPVAGGPVRSIAAHKPQCDGEGNVFYKAIMSAPADPFSGPLVRISADGRQVVNYSADTVPDLRNDKFNGNHSVDSWTPGLRGELHMLAYKDSELYILHFDDGGKFQSLTKVEARFLVSQLAVFPTGEFLAAGEKLPEKKGDLRGEPFTAIFDMNGKLIKPLSFTGDTKLKPDAKPGYGNEAIQLGEVAPADDGNIYLMRAAEKPLIFVISPAGEVVRKLTLEPPGKEYHGGHFSVAGGKIVMEFFKPNHDKQNSGTNLFSLYDAETGERQLDYDPPPEGGIFACYTPNQFTFVGVQKSGLSIVHAVTR